MHASLRTSFLLVLLPIAARSQACGGPCEIPRGADPVPVGRFSLTAGPEKANWRYLFNWIWTEDGKAKHRLEEVLRVPPLWDFGYRRMFVSPAGNGFLVTGNAYGPSHARGEEAPLFEFRNPTGRSVVSLSLRRILRPKERKLGKCPGCSAEKILYVFAEDPKASANRCFVDLKTHGAGRAIGFFLLIPMPVFDRARFDAELTRAEREFLGPARCKRIETKIGASIEALNSGTATTRAAASEALLARGYLARTALHTAAEATSSEAFRVLARSLRAKLQPWRVAGWNAMRRDLPLLRSLMAQPQRHTSQAAKLHLDAMLPEVRKLSRTASSEWLERHSDRLVWNAKRELYELRTPSRRR